MLATSSRSCSARFLALIRFSDPLVHFFPANLHFLFDESPNDSVAEIEPFPSELL
jgi:hypothetical protein